MNILANNIAAAYCSGLVSTTTLGGENASDTWSGASVIVDTMTRELRDPVGIAVDPRSGALLVAEPEAGRISIVLGRTVVGAFHSEFSIRNPIGAAQSDPLTRSRWNHPRLRMPVDLTFDPSGRLFVAESAPGARVLMFDLRQNGFSSATVILCSPANQARVFSSIDFDDQSRLCAISYDMGSTNPSPLVEAYFAQDNLAWNRVESGAWIDYPFASKLLKDREAAEPVLEWLYAQPSLARMAVDRATGDVYATMRRQGTVVKVKRAKL